MIDGILARHQRYGWSRPVGEWGAIQSEDRAPLHRALDAGDPGVVAMLLRQMFRGPLAFGLVSLAADPEHSMPPMVYWRVALWSRMVEHVDMERLAAPRIGNPMVVYVAAADGPDVPVMVDTPRFDCYAQRIATALPADGTVLEIGCGYGGTALQLIRAGVTRVVLCDIPETLYLAWFWLAHILGADAVSWWDEGKATAITLLPAHELEQWTGRADLVFSAHTLSGLDRAAIAGYMAWLERSGARYFYHDDATRAAPGVWLADAFPEVLAGEIVPPACYVEQWRERTRWSGLGDRFSEFFYERAA